MRKYFIRIVLILAFTFLVTACTTSSTPVPVPDDKKIDTDKNPNPDPNPNPNPNPDPNPEPNPDPNPDLTREFRTEMLYLPGQSELREVGYEVINGLAIFEGDIILGEVDNNGLKTQALAREDDDLRWNNGIVPFEISDQLPALGVGQIYAAIAHWEDNTDIEFVEQGNGIPGTRLTNHVRFVAGSRPNSCFSAVGKQGGEQLIQLTSNGTCNTGTLIHEIGHAIGLWHEQSRKNRNDFVTINLNNVRNRSDLENNFEIHDDLNIGPYDYGSIMHYGCWTFSIDTTRSNLSQRTIVPKNSNVGCSAAEGKPITLGQRNGLSQGDLEAVRRMYPREATIWHQGLPIGGTAEANDKFGSAVAIGDFNGDGIQDLAVGVPNESVGSIENAGAVNVLYGTLEGLQSNNHQVLHQNEADTGKAEIGDQFGSALTTGDFNGDGKDDLAVGIPFEDVGNIVNAGAVSVFYGSAQGLRKTGSQLWTQGSSLQGAVETNDLFGAALNSADYNGDGKDDLAIGAPNEAIGSVKNAGAVNIILGSSDGLISSGNQVWHQDSTAIFDKAEAGDFFGQSLSSGDFNNDGKADLAVGVPGESVDGKANAGAVHIIRGGRDGLTASSDLLLHQGLGDIRGSVEANDAFASSLSSGDFNNDGHDDLAVGAPNEAIGSLNNAGSISIFYGSSNGLASKDNQLWHQNSSGISGAAETDDLFANALTSGDFNGDGHDDLAIGVHWENIRAKDKAGAVAVIFGSNEGLSSDGNQLWYQGRPGISGNLEAGDLFGTALAAGDLDKDGDDDLAIGVPGESLESAGGLQEGGAVNILYYLD